MKKKKEKISHRQLGPLRGSSSPFQHFEPARVNPIKLAYSPSPPDNGLGQYVSSPGTGLTVTQNSPFLPWR